MRRSRRRLVQRLKLAAAIVIIGFGLMVAMRPFFFTWREMVIAIGPILLAVMLLSGWPKTRRVKWTALAVYVIVMLVVIAVALYIVARIANGVVMPREVLVVTYFAFGWRIAWELWNRTVGGIGQKRIRLLRLRGRELPSPSNTMGRFGIHAFRAMLTACVFIPFFFATVTTLRVKIGNAFDPESYAGMEYDDAVFKTEDGLTLRGWFIPSPHAESTVIICHGMGANKGNFFEFVRLFFGQKFNSLIFDFRGHGDSDSHTTGMGLLEDGDVCSAVDWLKSNKPKQSRHVFGIGSSMGAAALLRAAVGDSRIEAVVLDSCYASAETLADQQVGRFKIIGPVLANVVMAFMSMQLGESVWSLSPMDVIDQLDGRAVLLIHATDDVLIPPVNMDMLYDRAKQPKAKWLGPGTHSNVLTTDFDQYQDRVLEFFRRAESEAEPMGNGNE